MTISEPIAPPRVDLRLTSWGVMLSFMVHGLIVSTWVSRIASIKPALHLSDGALGLAFLGTAIGSIAAIPVSGLLVTRFGSRRTARWTGVGFCIALVAPALAWNAITLFAALLIYGAMAGANDVAMNAQAAGTERLLGVPAMSRFHALFSLGGIAGASAGALIASRGISPLTHLAFSAGILLIVALAWPRLTIEIEESQAPARRLPITRLPIALVALSAIGFCIFLSEGAIADWSGVYLKQILRVGDGSAAAGYAIFSVAMTIFRFTGDAIVTRIGRARMIRIGGLVAAAGLSLTVSAHSLPWALAGLAAAGAGFSSIIPLVFAAGGRIPSISQGAGIATVSGLGYLGFLIGPPTIGFVSEFTSLRMGLCVLVVLSIAAAMLVSAAMPEPRD